MGSAPEFTLAEVSLRRGSAVLLDDLSAEIPSGACTAVVGPSGAGKSTLLRLLNRFEDATAGDVTFAGAPIGAYDVLELRRRVALVAQTPVLLTERLHDELRVGRPGPLDGPRCRLLLSQVGLPASFLDRETAGLSGGEAQRTCLARALALDPRVLLLDEPTAALDPRSTRAIEQTISGLVGRGFTVVVVTHDRAQAQRMADHAVVLDQGRLVEAGPVDGLGYLRAGA